MLKLGHCHSVFSGQISYEESFGWRRQLLSLTCGKRISSCNEHRNRHTVVRIGRKKRVSWKNSDKCSHWRRVLISHYISCQCTCLHPHCQQCVMVETAKSAFQVETKRFRSWYVKLSDSPFYIYIFMWVLYLTGYLWFIPKKKSWYSFLLINQIMYDLPSLLEHVRLNMVSMVRMIWWSGE